MRLDDLFDRNEWTFRVQDWPDGILGHLAAHVVGGAVWFLVGVVFLNLGGWQAGVFPGMAELLRQELMREAKGWREFPLWAVTIDTLTTLATGLLLGWICGMLR